MSVITKEIETNNGKWYQMMTMPYIQTDNKTNGAIITFNDITELKLIQLELDKTNKNLMNIMQTLIILFIRHPMIFWGRWLILS